MSRVRWVPAWLGAAYSKLYSRFGCEPFALPLAGEVLSCSSSLTRTILSRLRSATLASMFSKVGRKRVYRLLDPETWVLLNAVGARNLDRVSRGPYFNLVCAILRSLAERYGRDLVSLVLYGSVARGCAGALSDVDVIVVSESFSGSIASRIDELVEGEEPRIRSEIAWLARHGIHTDVSYLPLRPDEALRVRPLYLDLVHDAVILYDRLAFFEGLLARLKARLEELGARRVFLSEDEWYWVLKPSIKVGEVIEI